MNIPIQKINLNKLPFKNLVIICLATVCIYSVRSCSIKDIELSKTNEEWKFKLSAKERQFTKRIQADSSVIATQQLRIFSEEEAKTLALIENERLKNIKSVVRTNTVTRIESVFVPFEAMSVDLNTDYENTCAIPQDTIKYFKTNNEWYSINGSVSDSGVLFDSVSFKNSFSTTIGYEKSPGALGFLKKKNPVVEIKSDNPYTDITAMDNIIIKEDKKFYQTTGFKIGVGVLLGGIIIK